jgi:hypothetical protein
MRRKSALLLCLTFATYAVAQTNLSLPEGTAVKMRLENAISTFGSKVGDSFSGRVTAPVSLNSKTVIPVGSTIEGRVIRLTEPRRIKGKPTISLFPDMVTLPSGEKYVLHAVMVDTNVGKGTDVNEEGEFKGQGMDGHDKKEIAIGTGAGVVSGALIGGGEGALVGAAIGGGATVVHWLVKKRYTTMPAGTEVVMELSRPMELSAASSGR